MNAPLHLVAALLAVFALYAPVAAWAQPAPAEADEPLPRKATLFDGKSLGKWKVIEKHVFENHGKVEVADGQIRLAEGQPASGIVYSGSFPTDNYEIRLEAQRTAGSDFFCGLTFPVGKSHTTLILGGWGGSVTGISNLEGYAAVENETTGYVDFKNGQWYGIRLRVTTGKVEAWVNSEQVVDVERKDNAQMERDFSVWWEQEPARPLGISTWRTSAALRGIVFERVGN